MLKLLTERPCFGELNAQDNWVKTSQDVLAAQKCPTHSYFRFWKRVMQLSTKRCDAERHRLRRKVWFCYAYRYTQHWHNCKSFL